MSTRANASRCFSPPESMCSQLGVFIEPVEEMAQPDFLDRLTDDGIVHRLGRRGDRSRHGAACRAARTAAAASRTARSNLIRISPPPHGHRPAIARTSVLLPVPDSPTTSTFSPGAISISASLHHRAAIVQGHREVPQPERCHPRLACAQCGRSFLRGPRAPSGPATPTRRQGGAPRRSNRRSGDSCRPAN